MAGQPKPTFYIALVLVVAGLIGLAVWRADILAPKQKHENGKVDPKVLVDVESPDGGSVTTVKEYTFVPSQKLPPVTGISAYKPLEENDNTVDFALNTWAGWAPIILANEGFAPKKIWKTPEGKEFKVNLILADDPVKMRQTYVSQGAHIGWATLDMLPLFVDAMVDSKDSRIMPRVFQQVDFSNGGDGIVVRKDVKTVADLAGKKLALAQNSPSNYFALNMLVAGGLQPRDVKFEFTPDAFAAAAAFNGDQTIAGCVSWAPDIYNLEKKSGNRMLVTTLTANKLIADVWFARADFAKDHPDICEALVRGIFDAMAEMKDEAKRKHAAELMAAGYNIPPSETINMLGDAHSTNWAENYQFFMNQNNPANFERIWNQAYYLYRAVGQISHQPVPFDQVMDFSIIAKLGKEEKYSSTKDEYKLQLMPKTALQVKAENDQILTNTVMIHFFPNSPDLYKKIQVEVDGKTVERNYDPSVDAVIEEIGKLAGQFGNARIIIEGHTDDSMKGRVPDDVVKDLSQQRANAVKQALADKFKTIDPNQFTAVGMGWDAPADPDDPENHAKNRRVEVKVYTAEQQ